MKTIASLGGGLAGACAVTLIHESVRKIVPKAPRMDLLGMNAISKGLNAAGIKTPTGNKLYTMALAGDILSNSIYYALAGTGDEKNIWLKSSMLGLAAGIGAVLLPGPLGLEEKHSARSTETKLMTIGLYVTGALVATVIMKLMAKKKHKQNQEWERRLVTSAMG
ncbi:MAG TPA: hypothetical protein VNT20_08110 [Flavisolibacter sp.]|jgi:hypothetical protein|nr:hypothetical protein [Flavisolibacter sp.]